MKKFKWLIVCIIILLVSIFLHECGHGIANAISGIECSTGFNRVGDIYKYPKDIKFKEEYSKTPDVLLDFGVPCNLLLAIFGSVLCYKSKKEYKQYLGYAIASTNSILRLIPCLMVIIIPLVTGSLHKEDELGTGLLLVQKTGLDFFTFVPAIISIAISIICIILIILKAKQKGVKHILIYGLLVIVSFVLGMIIANYLDNIFRINWYAFT